MSKHVVLTYAYLRSLKPAAAGKRYFVGDALAPGLKVTVSDHRSMPYRMKRRWPGHKQPTWHKVADVYVSSKTKTDNDIDAKAEQHGAGVLTILEARNVALMPRPGGPQG